MQITPHQQAKATPELEKMADDIMESFDFQKVHAVMRLVEWKWSCNGELRVPTLDEIRAQARRLLDRVVYHDPDGTGVSNCATGGFCAYRFPWGVELVFAFERASRS